jgi:hypothetical protein
MRRHPGLISLFGLNSIIKKELSHPANSLPERAAKIKLFFGSGAPRLPDLFRAVQPHTENFLCASHPINCSILLRHLHSWGLTQDLTAALS